VGSDENGEGNHQSSHCHPHHSQVPDGGPNPNPGQKLQILAVEIDYRHETLAVEVFPEECGVHPLSLNVQQSATLSFTSWPPSMDPPLDAYRASWGL